MRRVLGIGLLLLAVAACDSAEDDAAADAAIVGCVASDLVAQCPIGTNPVVGERAAGACANAAGGISVDGEGQADGQCLGAPGCRVLCQFAVPCRCGVAEITGDGVTCASCDGAASCGNGICEGGESPANCSVDCGARCEADERRCNGELLEECSLQGRWETLACPDDEVCSAEDGAARCVRDVEIIGGMDAGVNGDAQVLPEEGRVIPGDGTWPSITPSAVGQTPRAFDAVEHVIRLDDGSIHNRPTRYQLARIEVAGNAGGNGTPRPLGICYGTLLPDENLHAVYSVKGRFVADFMGGVQILEVPFTADHATFCDDWALCNGRPVEDCEALIEQEIATFGETRLQCIADLLQADGQDACVPVLFGDACGWEPNRYYPDRVEFGGRTLERKGARILGLGMDQQTGMLVDLDAEAVQRMDAVGEFRLQADDFALSDDGQTALFVGSAGQDGVIVVWDLAAQTRRPILPISGGSVQGVSLSPDGQVAAMIRRVTGDVASDGFISLWNLAEERRILSIRPIEGGHFTDGAVFSPDGRHLALIHQRPNQVEIWDLQTAQRTQILQFDGEAIADGLAFSPDGSLLAVEWRGATLTFWDVASGQRIFTQAEAGLPVFTADGARALTQSPGGFLARFFVLTGR